jgi:hypothetical protein
VVPSSVPHSGACHYGALIHARVQVAIQTLVQAGAGQAAALSTGGGRRSTVCPGAAPIAASGAGPGVFRDGGTCMVQNHGWVLAAGDFLRVGEWMYQGGGPNNNTYAAVLLASGDLVVCYATAGRGPDLTRRYFSLVQDSGAQHLVDASWVFNPAQTDGQYIAIMQTDGTWSSTGARIRPGSARRTGRPTPGRPRRPATTARHSGPTATCGCTTPPPRRCRRPQHTPRPCRSSGRPG